MDSRRPAFLIFLYFTLLLVFVIFLPSPGLQFSGSGLIPRGDKTKISKESYKRNFKWNNVRGQEVSATITIPRLPLKKEIKEFGKPKGKIHPLLLPSRGFRIIDRRHTVHGTRIVEHYSYVVDYKAIYKKNLKYFPAISRELINSIRKKNPAGILYPLLRFIQSITYKLPPGIYKGKDINSFFVPLVCLYEQYGDCDSKSVLLADILSTVSDEIKPSLGMILIRGRGIAHAVLAVKADLLPGMTAVYVKGDGYYLALETTSPGWTPGFIAPRLTKAITSGYFSFLKLN